MRDAQWSVLVIASDGTTQHVVQYHLKRAGFEVEAASNSTQAAQTLRNMSPDVVVCELGACEATTGELRKAAFLDPATRQTPFIFFGENGGLAPNASAPTNGADEYLPKPLDPLALIARVQSIVTKRKTHELMMRTDPLTHLLNRATFEQWIGIELARLARYGRSASLALLDIDGLKELNETKGDAMGDLALTTLASVIGRSIRTTDLAGRYQGQQFVLYLAETPSQGGVTLLERLQADYEATSEQATGAALNFSAGVVQAPCHGNEWEDLITHACAAVREAKAKGRRCITSWANGSCTPT